MGRRIRFSNQGARCFPDKDKGLVAQRLPRRGQPGSSPAEAVYAAMSACALATLLPRFSTAEWMPRHGSVGRGP
jgi:hypothetical protein